MSLKTRDGAVIETDSGKDKMLRWLYGNAFGRIVLKPLTARPVSKLVGGFMSTRASCFMIKSFIKKNNIDMTQFEDTKHKSYNSFFTRKLRDGARPVDLTPEHLISPCDCKLTVLPVTADGSFVLKHTPYTVGSLLRNEELAQKFEGGYVLIFRLAVDDYHRYHFFDDANVGQTVRIRGVLHTVNPLANDHFPIYKENTREYTTLHTKNFGEAVMVEVGAMMVGRIVNHPGKTQVVRGEEKGMFQFGGSTVVVLLQKDAAVIDEDLLENSAKGIETKLRYGEKIGKKK